MQLGIMQPYVFPYIGYFQLIQSVDKFVIYDDVQFIKQGWVNRNRVLLNGKAFLFSVPVKDISSNRLIKETEIDSTKYSIWVRKFLTTLQQAYKKAPFYTPVYSLIQETLLGKAYTNISELATESILLTSRYIGLSTEIVPTSTIYKNQHLKAKERVLSICKQERAETYINPVGGMELYSKNDFSLHGVELKFIQSNPLQYLQYHNEFVPWLSIIDVMMFNQKEDILAFTSNYQFK